MTKKYSVLFVCIHNSARSQMAEAFWREIGGDYFIAVSVSLEAGCLNSLVIKVMSKIGLDISAQSTHDVDSVIQRREQFDYVITVCESPDKAAGSSKLQCNVCVVPGMIGQR